MNTLDASRMLWDYYLWSTVLLAAVLLAFLLIRQPARRMAIAWATVGGLLVLLLLTALPNWSRYSLGSPTPATNTLPADLRPVLGQAIQQTPVKPVAEREPLLPGGKPVAVPTYEVAIDVGILMTYTLVAGSSVVIVWLVIGAWQARRLRSRVQSVPREVESLLAQLAPQQRVELGMLAELPVPVALGLRRPCILLPQTLIAQPNHGQLRSVLAHELAHVEHRDLWLLAVLRLLSVVLWPHPLFWLLRRQVRHDQEVLADAAAAELTSRTDYAEQLVALARAAIETRIPRLASSVGLWEKRTQLTERIKLLLDEQLTILRNCSRGWRLGSLVVLGGLALALSLVTVSPAEVQIEEVSTTEDTEGTELVVEKAKPLEDKQTDRLPQQSSFDLNETLRTLSTGAKPNTVTGICFDENNQPLSGVNVQVFVAKSNSKIPPHWAHVGTTDANGVYEFKNVVDIGKEFPNGLPDNLFILQNTPVVTIVARAMGRVPGIGSNLASHVAKEGMSMPLSMPPAKLLSGRVVDQNGQPVVGATVSSGVGIRVPGIPDDINSAITDAEGRFEINDLEAYDAEQARKEFEARQQDYLTFAGSGMPWERFVTVEHPDYARKRVRITSIPGSVDVTLSPGAVLAGKVVTQEAGAEPKPAMNAEVMAMLMPAAESPSPFSYQVLNAKTDEAGNYRFESLPAGAYAVHAYLHDWVSNKIDDVNVVTGETATATSIMMTRGGRVQIQLVNDATGKPLTFDKPTKAYVNPQPRPQKSNSFGRPNIVEFSREGIGEIQVPAGKFAFHINIPASGSLPGWMAAEFARIRSQEDYDKLTAYQTDEGKVVEIEVRMVREGEPAKSQLVPSESVKEKPTGQLIPATVPAEVETGDESDKHTGRPTINLDFNSLDRWRDVKSLDLVANDKTSGTWQLVPSSVLPSADPSTPLSQTVPMARLVHESDKHTAIPPKLLYLAWQAKETLPGSWRNVTLWDPAGKTLGEADARAFLARAGDTLTSRLEYDPLTPLILFFEVDKSIDAPVMPTLITNDGVSISSGSARTRQVDGINTAAVVASRSKLPVWPDSVSLELHYATENWQVIKTVTEVAKQPIEIAEGVWWYLDHERARERDPETGRLRWSEGKTAGVLEISESVTKGLSSYAVRVYLKSQPTQLREAYVTVVTRDDGNHTIRVSDAIESAEQIERVEFIRQQRAIETIDNVPLRLDLLPEDRSLRTPPLRNTEYEDGVLRNGENYR